MDLHALRSLTLGLLIAATVTDTRRREIPDAVPAALLAAALAWQAAGALARPWMDLALGCLVGFMAGLLLFWRGGFGGGDAKMLAALGAVEGFSPLFGVLFYTALAGGVLAVIALARGTRELAYMPAITSGYVAAWAIGRPW